MTVKEQLTLVRKQEFLLRDYEEELLDLRRRAYSISSPQLSEKIQSNHQSSLDDVVMKLDLQARKVNEEWDKLLEMKKNAENLINLETDPVRRCVLHKYYIRGKSWEQVADEMNYSLRQITSFHGQALHDLEVIKKRLR